jgi:hypothetical protein
MSVLVAGTIAVALLSSLGSELVLRPLPKVVPLTWRFRPRVVHRTIKAATPAHKALLSSHAPVAASIHSSDWTRQVERGRTVAYSVVALDSLPVLRSFAVTLAFDTHFPRGTTYLLDLVTGVFSSGLVPANRIVRELEGLSTPDIQNAKRRAEAELGQPVRVFALYPPDLYLALRGYADAALRNSGGTSTSVAAVTVRLRLTGPRQFSVALEK